METIGATAQMHTPHPPQLLLTAINSVVAPTANLPHVVARWFSDQTPTFYLLSLEINKTKNKTKNALPARKSQTPLPPHTNLRYMPPGTMILYYLVLLLL